MTLSEFLNDEKNQGLVLEKIIEALRERGEWGKYGIFAKIADPIGFSQSYVSKTLKGKMPIRENFVERMAKYLTVETSWLTGDDDSSYQDATIDYHAKHHLFTAEERYENSVKICKKYSELIEVFRKVPTEEKGIAIELLKAVWQSESDSSEPPSTYSKL